MRLGSPLKFLLLYLAVQSMAAAVAREQMSATNCEGLVNKVASATLSSEARVSALESNASACATNEFFVAKLAFELNQIRRFEDSQRLVSRALPNSAKLTNNLRAIFVSNEIGLGQLDAAEVDARRFAKLSPRFASFHFEMAEIAAERHQWDQATAAITTAFALDHDALYLMLRASYRYQMKDYSGTLADVQEALRRDPSRIASPVGLTEGVYALVMTGRRDEARQLLRRHVDANPNWSRYEPMLRVAHELEH